MGRLQMVQLQLAQAETRAQQLEAAGALASERESLLEKRASNAEGQLSELRSKNAGLLAKVTSLEELKANDSSSDAQEALRRMHAQQVGMFGPLPHGGSRIVGRLPEAHA